MITIAVSAIIMTMAVPSFSNMVLNGRLTSSSEELVKGLQLTRSEAMRRGMVATICASNGGTSCDGTSWNQGWIVWVDVNGDNVVAAGEIQRVFGALAATQQLTNVENVLTIGYAANGFLNGVAPGALRSFAVCDERVGETGRSVVVRAFGHISTTATVCS